MRRFFTVRGEGGRGARRGRARCEERAGAVRGEDGEWGEKRHGDSF
ncbi:MAG: hypothetical protein ACTSU9_17920 [Promethearchaeota archaeon]